MDLHRLGELAHALRHAATHCWVGGVAVVELDRAEQEGYAAAVQELTTSLPIAQHVCVVTLGPIGAPQPAVADAALRAALATPACGEGVAACLNDAWAVLRFFTATADGGCSCLVGRTVYRAASGAVVGGEATASGFDADLAGMRSLAALASFPMDIDDALGRLDVPLHLRRNHLWPTLVALLSLVKQREQGGGAAPNPSITKYLGIPDGAAVPPTPAALRVLYATLLQWVVQMVNDALQHRRLRGGVSTASLVTYVDPPTTPSALHQQVRAVLEAQYAEATESVGDAHFQQVAHEARTGWTLWKRRTEAAKAAEAAAAAVEVPTSGVLPGYLHAYAARVAKGLEVKEQARRTTLPTPAAEQPHQTAGAEGLRDVHANMLSPQSLPRAETRTSAAATPGSQLQVQRLPCSVVALHDAAQRRESTPGTPSELLQRAPTSAHAVLHPLPERAPTSHAVPPPAPVGKKSEASPWDDSIVQQAVSIPVARSETAPPQPGHPTMPISHVDLGPGAAGADDGTSQVWGFAGMAGLPDASKCTVTTSVFNAKLTHYLKDVASVVSSVPAQPAQTPVDPASLCGEWNPDAPSSGRTRSAWTSVKVNTPRAPQPSVVSGWHAGDISGELQCPPAGDVHAEASSLGARTEASGHPEATPKSRPHVIDSTQPMPSSPVQGGGTFAAGGTATQAQPLPQRSVLGDLSHTLNQRGPQRTPPKTRDYGKRYYVMENTPGPCRATPRTWQPSPPPAPVQHPLRPSVPAAAFDAARGRAAAALCVDAELLGAFGRPRALGYDADGQDAAPSSLLMLPKLHAALAGRLWRRGTGASASGAAVRGRQTAGSTVPGTGVQEHPYSSPPRPDRLYPTNEETSSPPRPSRLHHPAHRGGASSPPRPHALHHPTYGTRDASPPRPERLEHPAEPRTPPQAWRTGAPSPPRPPGPLLHPFEAQLCGVGDPSAASPPRPGFLQPPPHAGVVGSPGRPDACAHPLQAAAPEHAAADCFGTPPPDAFAAEYAAAADPFAAVPAPFLLEDGAVDAALPGWESANPVLSELRHPTEGLAQCLAGVGVAATRWVRGLRASRLKSDLAAQPLPGAGAASELPTVRMGKYAFVTRYGAAVLAWLLQYPNPAAYRVGRWKVWLSPQGIAAVEALHVRRVQLLTLAGCVAAAAVAGVVTGRAVPYAVTPEESAATLTPASTSQQLPSGDATARAISDLDRAYAATKRAQRNADDVDDAAFRTLNLIYDPPAGNGHVQRRTLTPAADAGRAKSPGVRTRRTLSPTPPLRTLSPPPLRDDLPILNRHERVALAPQTPPRDGPPEGMHRGDCAKPRPALPTPLAAHRAAAPPLSFMTNLERYRGAPLFGAQDPGWSGGEAAWGGAAAGANRDSSAGEDEEAPEEELPEEEEEEEEEEVETHPPESQLAPHPRVSPARRPRAGGRVGWWDEEEGEAPRPAPAAPRGKIPSIIAAQTFHRGRVPSIVALQRERGTV